MTRDRRFKAAVRARMRRTGEPYTAALARLQHQQPPRPDPAGGSGMYAFERFTEQSKAVLTLAQEEAERARHSYIGTEHLLIGLLRQRDGLGGRVLVGLGVELDAVRDGIEKTLAGAPTIIVARIIPTSRVKKVIELAFDEAQGSGQANVGTYHLLLGLLLEGEGVAAHVLRDLGVTLDRVRQEVGRRLAEGGEEAVGGPSGRTAHPMANSGELQQLLWQAWELANRRDAAAIGPDHVLEAAAMTDPGLEVLARLLELGRVAALKEEAIAAEDHEAAARHQAEEERLRPPFEEAMAAWRAELGRESST
ncbi:MAG: hypothetical protein J2P45_01185 [Candidatus Dormibacteraeota bacterium]|nr:hypothetical protein [Candidatus Dormibacteraeota bacterium]